MSQPPYPQIPESAALPGCWWHPKRQTGLSCVRCGRPACPDCLREAAVGLINGLTLGALLGPIVFLWFGIGTLGIVIAIALIINLFTAAVAGILVPLALDRVGFDPAVASATFVTTITDVIGFLAFLGLATLVLL